MKVNKLLSYRYRMKERKKEEKDSIRQKKFLRECYIPNKLKLIVNCFLRRVKKKPRRRRRKRRMSLKYIKHGKMEYSLDEV